MTDRFVYRRGDELPGIDLPWQEETSAGVYTNLNLTSGHTFTVTLTPPSGVAISPTVTVTGYDGGVRIAWAASALDITPEQYRLEVVARETSTGKDRTWRPDSLPIVQVR